MKATHSTIAFLAALLFASEAHASDVDNLFPLQGIFFGLILLGILVPLLPLAPIAAVAGLYALLVERRRAVGLGAVVLASISLAGVAALHMGSELRGSWLKPAAVASIVLLVPLTWVLLWRGMIKHWPPARKNKGAMVGAVIGFVWFIGEAAWVRAETAIPPPVLDAGYAARRCNRLTYECPTYAPVTVDTDARIDACVATLPVCQTKTPWNEVAECCPAACVASYAEERALHQGKVLKDVRGKDASSAEVALRVAFDPSHECHPGVHDEFRSRGYQPPPIRGRMTTPRP